jgi:general stress protein 26
MANSINAQSPEDNHEDLAGADAVQRIQDVVDKTETCFFCTAVSTGGSGATRPMSVQEVDDRGHLWFLVASDSHTVAEIGERSDVRLFFQGSEHANFLVLTGRAAVGRDPKRIDDLWEPILKTWFTEGKDDPRIRTIEVAPEGGYYWDNKHGSMVAGIKMLVGAAIGKTLDDSIEGQMQFR